MTITRVGSNQKFAENWSNIFGKKKEAPKSAAKSEKKNPSKKKKASAKKLKAGAKKK
jgi:hypothetical protein